MKKVDEVVLANSVHADNGGVDPHPQSGSKNLRFGWNIASCFGTSSSPVRVGALTPKARTPTGDIAVLPEVDVDIESIKVEESRQEESKELKLTPLQRENAEKLTLLQHEIADRFGSIYKDTTSRTRLTVTHFAVSTLNDAVVSFLAGLQPAYVSGSTAAIALNCLMFLISLTFALYSTYAWPFPTKGYSLSFLAPLSSAYSNTVSLLCIFILSFVPPEAVSDGCGVLISVTASATSVINVDAFQTALLISQVLSVSFQLINVIGCLLPILSFSYPLHLEANKREKILVKEAEKEARLKEEARLKAKEEARLEAEEEEARLREIDYMSQFGFERWKAEEEARLKAEKEVKRLAEEEAKRLAEEEARRFAKEEARLAAEEEAKRLAEEEAQRLAKEEARLAAEEEAQRQVDEEARHKPEELRRYDEELKKFSDHFKTRLYDIPALYKTKPASDDLIESLKRCVFV